MGGPERARRFGIFPFPFGRRPEEIEVGETPREPVNGQSHNGQGDASAQTVQRDRKKERREFFAQGGIIREAELSKNAGPVAALYVQPSAIEHFADVTPFTTQEELDAYLKANPLPEGRKIGPTNAKEIKAYYKNNPGTKLWVAELGGEIVGAVTIAPQMQGGINEVKLNRLVVKEDKRGHDIAMRLNREALVQSFLIHPEEGGPAGCTIGVIHDVEGSEAARRVFKKLNFGTTMERATDRCFGWDNKKGRLVLRDVEQMYLPRTEFARRWGSDLHRGTSLPNGKAA